MNSIERIDYLLAGNPNTPPNVLEQLAMDKDKRVRLHIAENINTPQAVLERLADDLDSEVVAAVASHPSISRDLRSALVLHDNIGVRYEIAQNPLARASVLFMLVEDENAYVKERALETIRKFWVNEFCANL
ncbi:MAG: hypothetical protein SGJ27_20815 [Candidatus Melainabacteria bacterium]|nr:hypothetical protein [Candidatus Melainabacteria bacterium]